MVAWAIDSYRLGAVGVQLVEAAAVAGQRAALARRAPPRLLRRDLQVHDRVGGQRVAHALGQQRAAAQRHRPAAGAAQQAQHGSLLTLAERLLALAVEERLDGLPQLGLELAVGVQRLHAQLGRHRAGAAGLAGAHEPDEDQRPLGP